MELEPQPSDDMLFLCAEDGSLALTGRELRERNNNPRQQSVSTVGSAGRVLHAWEVTDRSGNVECLEYTTTQGYLVSDGEVIADGEAFAEVNPRTNVLPADRIEARVEEAAEETSFNGLKKAYSEEERHELLENARQISRFVEDNLATNLSIHFTGVWESTQPYLVGRDHQYRVPIRGDDTTFEDLFTDALESVDKFSTQQIKLLWEATTPELVVDLDLFIEGEQVA